MSHLSLASADSNCKISPDNKFGQVRDSACSVPCFKVYVIRMLTEHNINITFSVLICISQLSIVLRSLVTNNIFFTLFSNVLIVCFTA